MGDGMGDDLDDELRELSHGDHSCMVFTSVEQQAELTAPFLGIGLERDERSVFIGDATSVDAVREGLVDAGIDVDHEIDRGRLVLTSDQDYLADGRWHTEKMLSFLQRAYDEAMADGFTALRAAGDVSWQVGPRREFSEVAYYEALLDMFFVGKRMVGMCQYPKADCPAETLVGILQAHRVAAIDSEVCSNYHYMPPDLLVERDERAREQKRVEWMTSQLLRIKRTDEERDAVQEQLLHSQKLALVGRLAGSVGHDFNNILTCVIALSRVVLERSSLDEGTRADVEEIELAGERGAALTRQLLAFGRRHARRPQVLSLNDLVSGMEKLLSRIVGQDIVIETELGPGIGTVRADPRQIEQVVMNLAINARDAMSAGGTLTLSTANVDPGVEGTASFPGAPPGPHVMLAVSDTGCGMDQRTRSRIFEPFFTTKDAGQGTGLGLSTVHEIVEQHGGVISVESEPGEGTVFRVCLPRLETRVAAPSDERDRADSASELPSASKGTETVLVVDDDDTVRQLLRRVLASHGYTVLSAKKPSEAVPLCETYEGPVHLMITDVLSAWTGDDDLMKRLDEARPDLKVLFTPGHADQQAAAPDLLARGRAVLDKPFRPDAMLGMVRMLLDGGPSSP